MKILFAVLLALAGSFALAADDPRVRHMVESGYPGQTTIAQTIFQKISINRGLSPINSQVDKKLRQEFADVILWYILYTYELSAFA